MKCEALGNQSVSENNLSLKVVAGKRWGWTGIQRSLLSVLLLGAGAGMVMAENPDKQDSPTTIATEYDWCTLTCPKTCTPGEEFEVKLELKNLKETSKNWQATKLAVHLFWEGKEKWGGYVSHFGSVEVTKDGVQTLKGKFELPDNIKDEAAYLHVSANLKSDWSDPKSAAEFMGPKIEIVKVKAPAQKEPLPSDKDVKAK